MLRITNPETSHKDIILALHQENEQIKQPVAELSHKNRALKKV